LYEHENKSYGVAWSNSPEELQRAKDTISLLREVQLQLECDFWPALDHFIEVTQQAATERAANKKGSHIRNWLASRVPTQVQNELIEARLHAQSRPGVELLVLDQGGARERLERTLQSLDSSTGWHIHVLSASTVSLPADEHMSFTWLNGEPCADVLNRVMASSNADWFMLVEAGEEFTSSGQL